jgi:hypothetical protein
VEVEVFCMGATLTAYRTILSAAANCVCFQYFKQFYSFDIGAIEA